MTSAALSALLGHWRKHPGQALALILGLAIATALWSGVQAINSEARASYDRAANVMGQNQIARLASHDGQPIALADFVTLRRAGYLVSPVIEGRIGNGPSAFRVVGIDPLTAPLEALPAPITDGRIAFGDLATSDGLLLMSPETATRVATEDLPQIREIGGIPNGIAITDIATAAELLGQENPSYLLVRSDQPQGLPPITDQSLLRYLEPEITSDISRLTDSFHLNLTAFGLLAFVVGLFIVHATIGLAFEQRRATFRTLRAIGLPLNRLVALLAGEMVLVALLAGGMGIIIGYLIAAALLPSVAGSLRGLYGAQVSGELAFDPVWALSAMAIALLGAGFASVQALNRVRLMPILAPAQPRAWAMASARAQTIQTGLALVLFGLSAGLAIFGSSLITGFACLAALLIGAALALPVVGGAVLSGLGHLARSAMAQWALADTRQQLPGLSLALMALLLALAANIGVSTMVGSFRATFTGWLDQRLAAELYVNARNETEAALVLGFLEDHADAVLPYASADTRLGGLPAEIYGYSNNDIYRDNWPFLDALPNAWESVESGEAVLINEQLARRQGFSLGDELRLSADWSLPISGIYSDYGNPSGQAIIGLDSFKARYPDVPILRFAVRVEGDSATALAAALSEATGLPPENAINQVEVKQLSLRIFEQTFLVTGALNVLTLGVAGFAMLTSMLTLTSMRLMQLAPVWALGQTRATLAWFELARIIGLAVFTFVLALPTGLGLAWILLSIVNVEAFGWKLPMLVFPIEWLRLLGLAVLAALISAAWPALRLSRTPPNSLLKLFTNER